MKFATLPTFANAILASDSQSYCKRLFFGEDTARGFAVPSGKSMWPPLAHGMELVSHEAPRLTDAGPVVYDAYDADKPLKAGMVVSIETTLSYPCRGFIKLEDTVAVTPTGFEVYGDRARGWNRAGCR